MLHARRLGGPVVTAQNARSMSPVGCGEGQEMYGVELYAAVRLAVVDEGLGHHEAGRWFGIDRRTVKKVLSYSRPLRYIYSPIVLTDRRTERQGDTARRGIAAVVRRRVPSTPECTCR